MENGEEDPGGGGVARGTAAFVRWKEKAEKAAWFCGIGKQDGFHLGDLGGAGPGLASSADKRGERPGHAGTRQASSACPGRLSRSPVKIGACFPSPEMFLWEMGQLGDRKQVKLSY